MCFLIILHLAQIKLISAGFVLMKLFFPKQFLNNIFPLLMMRTVESELTVVISKKLLWWKQC